MSHLCPYCAVSNDPASEYRKLKKDGRFKRTSDGQYVQRYKCKICNRTSSPATFNVCYRQNKRHLNYAIAKQLRSNVSQRRTAENCGVTRKTVARKLLFHGEIAKAKLREMNRKRGPSKEGSMDEQVSFVHTKMKPVTIHEIVNEEREILGIATASAPANGRLAKRSEKKYGKRKDGRRKARRDLLEEIAPLIVPGGKIITDENPHYVRDIQELLPHLEHETHKGRKPRKYGNDELKEGGYDPLFKINHTSASFRANTSCLIRKTWNTTKKIECLEAHMYIYAVYHNEKIQAKLKKMAARQAAT